MVGGSAPATSWTLRRIAPGGALAGPTGTTGVTANVTPGVTYPLAESGGNPNYVQDVAPGAVLIPGSTGSWACVQVDANGNVIPGFSDGLNGGVTVPLGQRVRCTATNRTVELVLRKVVTNDFGGTAIPANWNLTVTPTGTPPAGVVAQTVTGSDVGAVVQIRPGQNYALSESGGPPGYELQSIECNGTAATSITLLIGQTADLHVHQPRRAADAHAGQDRQQRQRRRHRGARPTGRWLPPDPPPSPDPGTRSPRPVNAGSYTLSETGPAGYTASGWSCTGATSFTATSVNVGPGQRHLHHHQHGDQPDPHARQGGAATSPAAPRCPTAWTLSAAGPTPIIWSRPATCRSPRHR